MQDTGAAVTNDAAKAKGMTAWTPRLAGETFRRTVGAACANECVIAAARTVSAGVIFCGKERGTPYNLRVDVRFEKAW